MMFVCVMTAFYIEGEALFVYSLNRFRGLYVKDHRHKRLTNLYGLIGINIYYILYVLDIGNTYSV